MSATNAEQATALTAKDEQIEQQKDTIVTEIEFVFKSNLINESQLETVFNELKQKFDQKVSEHSEQATQLDARQGDIEAATDVIAKLEEEVFFHQILLVTASIDSKYFHCC